MLSYVSQTCSANTSSHISVQSCSNSHTIFKENKGCSPQNRFQLTKSSQEHEDYSPTQEFSLLLNKHVAALLVAGNDINLAVTV